jgi:hypothetical protein
MTKGIQHLDHVPMIRLSGEINPIWDEAKSPSARRVQWKPMVQRRTELLKHRSKLAAWVRVLQGRPLKRRPVRPIRL